MIQRINSYIGLDSVKEEVQTLYAQAKAAAWAKDLGQEPDKSTMHLIFEGNAGTGKSTMARDIGQLYYELGLVDKAPNEPGGFIELSAKDLIGEYVGQTAPKTARAIEPGLGGVIFVDEAYQLAGSKGINADLGQEALTELMVQAENNRSNTVFILAGYPDLAVELAAGNQGVESRFPNVLHFDDYDEDQRMEILDRFMGEKTLPTGDAGEEVLDMLYDFVGTPTPGNARDVRNAWDKVSRAQQRRIVDQHKDTFDELHPDEQRRIFNEITADDVRAAMGEKPPGKLIKIADKKKSA